MVELQLLDDHDSYLIFLPLQTFFLFRKCGKAVCDSCSTKKCPLPIKGHEFPVRVCENCYINVTEEE